jgi:hypothetical protein
MKLMRPATVQKARIAGDFACCCYAQQRSEQKSWGFKYLVRMFFK